jgi:hypothetical protein
MSEQKTLHIEFSRTETLVFKALLNAAKAQRDSISSKYALDSDFLDKQLKAAAALYGAFNTFLRQTPAGGDIIISQYGEIRARSGGTLKRRNLPNGRIAFDIIPRRRG